MTAPNWRASLDAELATRRKRNLFRHRRMLRPIDPVHVELDGQRCVNFASNDYLGLTHHPKVIGVVESALRSHGLGSGASALISGYTDLHAMAEADLARWKSTESSLLLSSGYQANLAAVQTLGAMGETHSGGVRFLIDKLAHASLIDAVQASGRAYRVFPHNHLDKLKRLLEESESKQLQVVVTESIFSMDGDAADLVGLAELKRSHDFLLLLDEAHGSGVYGLAGSGYASELGLQAMADVTIVTLGKALGCAGGAICASRLFCDAVVNYGRALIYTTNVPACIAAGVTASLQVLADEPDRQMRLRNNAQRVRESFSFGFSDNQPIDSPIIPVILGEEASAMVAAETLQHQGILVLPIRPPTVPRGSSRLRVTLSSEHTNSEVECLIAALKRMI